MANVGVTTVAEHWRAFKDDIERALDAAPLLTAHPEDTLVLAGPPHSPGEGSLNDLVVLGMLQMFNIASASPTTPLLALGSNRQFYSKAKAQNQVTLAKLLFNQGNLLYKLYQNVVEYLADPAAGDGDISSGEAILRKIDEPALSPNSNSKFMCDLDSPIFGLPFGLCVLFRTKVGLPIGGMYLERCTIQTWNLAFASGQNVVAENCAILFDRPVPFEPVNDVDDANNYLSGWDSIDDEQRQSLREYAEGDNKTHPGTT